MSTRYFWHRYNIESTTESLPHLTRHNERLIGFPDEATMLNSTFGDIRYGVRPLIPKPGILRKISNF
jgi:hypothetical protein